MDGNRLLHWLSHVGEGTWESFRRAVVEIVGAAGDNSGEEEFSDFVMRLRFRLSDLCYADFFPERRNRWRTLPPMLVSFAETPDRALACGGRTPSLLARFESAAQADCCAIETSAIEALPDAVVLRGDPEDITAVAANCGIHHLTDFASHLWERIVPVDVLLSRAPERDPMINWRQRFFDLGGVRWVDEPILRTACEFTPQFGLGVTLVQISRTKWVEMPRREAIYVAAALAGMPLLTYNAEDQALIVPARAALPTACARLACVQSGNLGVYEKGSVRYAPISLRVARIVMAAVGQTPQSF